MDKRITALKVQKRDPSRINVFLDGEFAFGLSRIAGAWLQVGQNLSEARIDVLLQEDEKEKAYQKALQVLQYRSRSEKELTEKLQSAGFSGEAVSAAMERLKENHLAGDLEFARAWADNRASFRPRSHRMLKMELRQKGVNDEIIDTVLQDTPDETALAETLAKKYQARLQDCDWPEYQKRLGGYLVRKGFGYGIAKEVVLKCWKEFHAGSDSG